MKQLFDTSSVDCSEIITKTYSTSFSLGIKLIHPKIRKSIYAIYGFVRYADEIVDSFHDFNQEELFLEFEKNYYKSLDRKISLNPILNSFQFIVRKYKLEKLVEKFMKSMKADLYKNDYSVTEDYEDYIHGSANVVGLMCLKVFVNGDLKKYNDLKFYAMSLGSAFQKVNFLRDLKDDYEILGRSYFPNLGHGKLDIEGKQIIILDIEEDFKNAYKGILLLPSECKLGVYVAYVYYSKLLQKLRKKNIDSLLSERTRISNPAKISLLLKSYISYKLNFI
jgi:phytoene/squalene synthetase